MCNLVRPVRAKALILVLVDERFWAFSPCCRCHITQGVIPLRSILPWAEAQVALSGRKLPWAEAQVALYSQSSSASSQGASCPAMRRLPFIRKAHQQAVRALCKVADYRRTIISKQSGRSPISPGGRKRAAALEHPPLTGGNVGGAPPFSQKNKCEE